MDLSGFGSAERKLLWSGGTGFAVVRPATNHLSVGSARFVSHQVRLYTFHSILILIY